MPIAIRSSPTQPAFSAMPASVAQALLSVSDKRGLVEFATGLARLGIALLSTGGTASALTAAGLAVTEIGDYTGFPEILDGRVKTLHPKVHAGILARRDRADDRSTLAAHGIPTIDLVAVNLYPFRETVAKPDVGMDEAIENIDIGGPALLRAAAKNWHHVAVLSDPEDYAGVLAELERANKTLADATRYRLAGKAFAHTAAYDGAVANWLTARSHDGLAETFPARFSLQVEKLQDLRYGENPHQQAALYRELAPAPGSLVTYRQRQGKELSYNNIADADAAWECARSFAAAPEPAACVIVKHANPCGVALGATPLEAYRKAFATDPISAYGGIIAFNRPLDAATVEAVAAQFAEVLLAPAYTEDALAALTRKPSLRVLEIAPAPSLVPAHWDLRRVGGGLLLQSPDAEDLSVAQLEVVTELAPSADQLADLLFVWRVAKYVKSNAIVYGRQGQTLGIGAGQMSRVDSTRIAAAKAQSAGLALTGSVVASDAFFPFRDGLDVVADQGAVAVIQPGGSVRDDEVIAAADERGIAMVFTGIRHFRH